MVIIRRAEKLKTVRQVLGASEKIILMFLFREKKTILSVR